MAARAYSGKKPKNLKHTLRVFLSYLGRHKKMLAVVAVLVTISAGANLLGTYMIRPVVNGLADGDVHTLLCGVLITALIFGCGALAAYGYTQTMVKAAQQVVFDIRRDLFEHVQTLPLQFFDSRRHGDIMSLFTNDIDTMADALNNSFAMVIQSFIQIVGTLTLLYILNWRLSLIVTVCYGIMFWYIKFSGKRSKGYYTKQQNSLGELNGYIEELITGQKVVKVFHHEEESFTEFCKKNEELRKAGTGAQGYAATMVPVVVSISYVNYAIVAVLGGLLALHGKADIGSLALNNSFAMVIQSFIQIVGTLTLLYILNWRLSLIVTVCYGIMFWYIKFSGKRSKGYYTKQQNSLGELNGYIEELITGQKVVKVFHHEEESFTEFCKKNEELRKAGTGAQGYAATMVPVVVSISYVNYAIVAVLGGLLALHGKADIGSLASYLVFVRQAALPINQFTQQSNFLLSALAGAERVFDVMSLEPEIDEGKVELVNVKEENGALAVCEETTGRWAWKRPDGTMTELKGDVRFENVDFGYTADRLILKNISLYAKPGQKIAFVGSTGAGKTTITNLINRFYDVQGGAVVYDGIDVKDIEKDALRHSLGIVLQDTHLFTGTVAENIRFGKLDATQEEIERAAKIANADSFIRRLPNGYDTMLTSDGANLSQGQRQLLAIARAAVADPPVLILDEATSSVDTRTEALIEKGMDQLMEGRTVFVIAHRLSTVRNANAIMVLEQGNIVERGDHDALLAQKGKYYQLYHGMFELS